MTRPETLKKPSLKYLSSIPVVITLLFLSRTSLFAACGADEITLPGNNCLPYPFQAGTSGTDRVLRNFRDIKLGDVVSSLLPSLLIFSGLTMFVYLIYGGFQLMTSGGDPKAIQSGQGKIVNALIGFGIIFASYWIIQILQVIFHISIISPI
ncbi:MAG: hypothetical protein UX31_C0012G0025 [Candidatus Nomurabacteria bacterium GW2011_GWA1_46_11]|uniref:Uncharacterized protein n=1 Tax=Candidatus Nomurabacteria bacterium GW2011_GWA1_46_11 TaxID=1618732 RepID=A0A0G1NMI4_9BACT|nr:MAG: hypothetical protein UW69_C0094G0006 [Microgenomates group bacterium GW2011_GWA2_44_7]KKT77964.1 MAG: hypothetical protein UW73_C0009G0063 [Microgenomates group bacterium GW2011_GWB1_44_8]KKU21789.1 MAG: hypothetical protein UX31_C0012G0025 [Candidatus Nomurabacteria bacterium GW2011_GWA1_46_11]